MKKQFEELTLPGFKAYFKAIVIKTLWYQCKRRQIAKKRNWRENPGLDLTYVVIWVLI